MRRMVGILAALFLLLGLAVILYQPVRGWIARGAMERQIDSFNGALEAAKSQNPDQGQPTAEQIPYSELLDQMQAYNQQLFANGQSGLVDAWSYEQSGVDLTEYGLPTQVVGVLSIPAMDQQLPVYLGATEENLAQGVAVLGQTSMPVGGENTNCVIAGHRGYRGQAFFREIERLQPGDRVTLTTYWGELVYQVEDTAVILPDQVDAVLIQPGRDLLTLITCHPYTVGTHRYVVYCAGVDGATDQVASDQPPAESGNSIAEGESFSSSRGRIEAERWLPLLAVPLLALAAGLLFWPGRAGKRDQKSPDERGDCK